MFLFSQETKTPVSTYTDSYRPPNSVKKIFQEPSARFWKENKFVTKGLTIPPVPSAGSPEQQEKLLKATAQEFAYRNAVEPSAYLPEKYWVTRQEERYNPVFVNEDRYVTWRTSPYNSAAWNKYTTYLPRLPKVGARGAGQPAGATRPRGCHLSPCRRRRWRRCWRARPGPSTSTAAVRAGRPRRPTAAPAPPLTRRPPLAEREVADMLSSFSRAPLPSVPQVYAAAARRPYQGYFSPCSGRHYCLRGMDYYGDVGRPDTTRHLHPLAERAVRFPALLPRLLLCAAQILMFISSPRWDSSHFKKAGGVQRGTFIIHPEFVSESCSAPLG
ncbi:SMRP1 protein, partial [Crypturellus soui]|nr:SMRP1 protein [Crypturellus soui]